MRVLLTHQTGANRETNDIDLLEENMSNSTNVHVSGGNQQQVALILQAHEDAARITQRALERGNKWDEQFNIWFGKSLATEDKKFVNLKVDRINNALNTAQFYYDLNQMLLIQVDNELVFILNSSSIDGVDRTLTVFPWKGLFLQTNQQAIIRQASLSIIHLVSSALDDWIDFAINSDREGAKLLSMYDSKNAMVSPRNYMYFVDAMSQ